jgi:hypothetical protein
MEIVKYLAVRYLAALRNNLQIKLLKSYGVSKFTKVLKTKGLRFAQLC